jgi:ribosome assembly protein 4
LCANHDPSLANEAQEDEPVPYTFFINEEEVVASLVSIVDRQRLQPEEVLHIVYQPQVCHVCRVFGDLTCVQAVFRVRSIAQCSATIPGLTHPRFDLIAP